ncbi:hypothetical protein [Candidatus Nitrosocosmicus oleophilus]|nr:hypothetical protein [Candidatus Nitrosocosmicus oleophilus]
MKHKPSNYSNLPFSIFLFVVFTVSTLYFLGYQQNNSVYALNQQDYKRYFHFVSEQDTECTENLPEEQTQMSESVCMQICPTDPTSAIPEQCVQQQPQGEDQSSKEEQQQPPLDQQQQQPPLDQQQQQPPLDQQQQQPPLDQQQQQPPLDQQQQQPPLDQQQQQPPLDQQQQQPPLDQQQQQPPLDQQQQQQPESDFTSPNNASTNKFVGVQNFGPSSSTNVNFSPASECYRDLTGKWIGNDGGKYYIRQIDKTVWWFGFNTLSIGEGFSNVFHGIRSGNGSGDPTIFGQWQDVPLGGTKGSGSFDIQIDPTGTKLTKFNSNGDFFGASEWTKSDPCSRISSGDITGPSGEVLKH